MIRIAIDVAILAGLANVLLLVAVLALRMHRLVRSRRCERLQRLWLPHLSRAAAGIEPAADIPSTLPDGDFLPWVREFNAVHDCVKGSATGALNALATRLDVSRRIRRALSSGSVQRRMIAVIAAGNLRDAEARVAVERELFSDNLLLVLLALRALIRIDGPAAIPTVVRTVIERDDLSSEQVAAYLADIEARTLGEPLERAILDAPPACVHRLVPLLRALDVAPAQRILARLLGAADDERTFSECLRLIEDPQALDSVRRYLGHERWHIRMLATAALGRIGDASDAPRLEALLRDSSWWVRYRAAQARVALASRTREALESLAGRIADRYGRAALVQAIAERGDP